MLQLSFNLSNVIRSASDLIFGAVLVSVLIAVAVSSRLERAGRL